MLEATWSAIMEIDKDVERLVSIAVSGDRVAARSFIEERIASGLSPATILSTIVAEAIDIIDAFDRSDRLSLVASAVASRVLRLVVSRVAETGTPKVSAKGRRIWLFCGPSSTEELIAESMARLLEYDGHVVSFGGGGVPSDEIERTVVEERPDVLLLYAASAADAPGLRGLIDHIRGCGACSALQIAVGGGIFARAPGLAEEIGADLWALDADDLRMSLIDDADRRAVPEQQTVGRGRHGRDRAVA